MYMQPTFPELSFEQYRKPPCREEYLDEMNGVVPRADLVAMIEPVADHPDFTIADDEWRFELINVPPGSYSVAESNRADVGKTR